MRSQNYTPHLSADDPRNVYDEAPSDSDFTPAGLTRPSGASGASRDHRGTGSRRRAQRAGERPTGAPKVTPPARPEMPTEEDAARAGVSDLMDRYVDLREKGLQWGYSPAQYALDISMWQQISDALEVADTLAYRLALRFVEQPWIHTYRGAGRPRPNLKVSQKPADIAGILQKAIDREELLHEKDGRRLKSEEKIFEVVDYGMKHFFDRVTNDEQAPGGLVYRFTGEDWFPGLMRESVDHWISLRLVFPTPEESQRRHEAVLEKFRVEPRRRVDFTAASKVEAIRHLLEPKPEPVYDEVPLTQEDCK